MSTKAYCSERNSASAVYCKWKNILKVQPYAGILETYAILELCMGHYNWRFQLLVKYVATFANGKDCALMLETRCLGKQTLGSIVLDAH